MKAKVTTWYDHGLRRSGDTAVEYRGELCLKDGGKVAMLELIDAAPTLRPLYLPHLVQVDTQHISFVGYEQAERRWHLQRWDCELL